MRKRIDQAQGRSEQDCPAQRGTGGSVSRLAAAERQALLCVARQVLDMFLRRGELLPPEANSPALLEPWAVFVTLRRRDTGDLRGCRGEVVAHRPLVEAVAQMAVASAIDDPRFPPVTLAELPLIGIEISALTPLQPIAPDEVQVGRHGLLIIKGYNRGLLLPQVAERQGWNREEFLRGVCRKAGLPEGAWAVPGAQLYAFETEVWEEDEAANALVIGEPGRLSVRG